MKRPNICKYLISDLVQVYSHQCVNKSDIKGKNFKNCGYSSQLCVITGIIIKTQFSYPIYQTDIFSCFPTYTMHTFRYEKENKTLCSLWFIQMWVEPIPTPCKYLNDCFFLNIVDLNGSHNFYKKTIANLIKN